MLLDNTVNNKNIRSWQSNSQELSAVTLKEKEKYFKEHIKKYPTEEEIYYYVIYKNICDI